MEDLVLNLSQNIRKPQKQEEKPTLKRKADDRPRNDNNKKYKNDSNHSQNTSKQAKFSSLFKNNPEIPTIHNSETNYTVRENLFSAKKFSDLDIHEHLIDCIEKRFKLTTLTAIQEKTIPAILNKSNCFIQSQTGSGKTLAYAIPLVQQLQLKQPHIKRTDGIFVLVLVPTRELAVQTCQVFEELCKAFIRIVPGALIGGMKKKSEKDRIRRGLNVLIATPGRLCDHLDTTMALDLSKVEYLVFDEADRMLDMDFEKKINFIIFKLNEKRKELNTEKPQTILISATLTNGIKEIARRLNVENAISIDACSDEQRDRNIKEENQNGGIKSNSTNDDKEKVAIPSTLSNYYMITPSKLRLIGLISLILDKLVYNNPKRTVKKLIIFVSTNDSVQFHEEILRIFLNHKFNLYFDDDEMSTFDLENSTKFNLFSLYGNLQQNDRLKTLKNFCQAETAILICTDVAARGLDMPNIDWIIQYNTPGTCHDYVHRVGRSARVGAHGKALIFLEPHEIEYVHELNKYGISLNELKLDRIMSCLVNEANYYPRQINADRLVIAKNAEDCANSLQFYIEECVEKTPEIANLARNGYLSFLRSYSTYAKEIKSIFNLKLLHLGHVAKSFGIRQAPNEIKSGIKNNVPVKNDYNKFIRKKKDDDHDDVDVENKEKETKDDAVKTKPKSNGLGGLLRNYKQVDEYSSGMEVSNKKPQNNNSRINSNYKMKLNDRLKSTSTSKKNNNINKRRDMSVFD